LVQAGTKRNTLARIVWRLLDRDGEPRHQRRELVESLTLILH
jgi:hypothetical protein